MFLKIKRVFQHFIDLICFKGKHANRYRSFMESMDSGFALLKINKTVSLCYKQYITKKGEKKIIKNICVGHTVSQEPSLCLEPEEIEYEGKIYCVNVPNHIVLVMRNGKTCWSGNSYRCQKYLRDYIGKAPDILGLGHAHKNGFFKVQNTYCFEAGAWQGPTNFTKSKGLWGSICGWIIHIKQKDGVISSLVPELLEF